MRKEDIDNMLLQRGCLFTLPLGSYRQYAGRWNYNILKISLLASYFEEN